MLPFLSHRAKISGLADKLEAMILIIDEGMHFLEQVLSHQASQRILQAAPEVKLEAV